MNIIDAIILICFIPALIQGIRKGFIAQVIAIISLVAGIWLSFRFARMTAGWLGQYIEASGQILQIVAFALILVLVIVGLFALGKLIEATVKIVMLGWLNKLLGAIFSILKCALILGLCIMAFNSINSTFHIVAEETLSGSLMYSGLKSAAYSVFPYLQGLLNFAR
ncbi:MAG: CvpA family protein [Candidatus Cryptobacteroides sp.]